MHHSPSMDDSHRMGRSRSSEEIPTKHDMDTQSREHSSKRLQKIIDKHSTEYVVRLGIAGVSPARPPRRSLLPWTVSRSCSKRQTQSFYNTEACFEVCSRLAAKYGQTMASTVFSRVTWSPCFVFSHTLPSNLLHTSRLDPCSFLMTLTKPLSADSWLAPSRA